VDWKLQVVVVPVSDVDRARAFYEQVGFVLDHDTQVTSDVRVVQLTPPGSACSIVFGTGVAEGLPGSLKGLQLSVSDVNAAHVHLTAQGVDASPVQHFEGGARVAGHGGVYNSFVFFDDPDGNSWAVQEGPV